MVHHLGEGMIATIKILSTGLLDQHRPLLDEKIGAVY